MMYLLPILFLILSCGGSSSPQEETSSSVANVKSDSQTFSEIIASGGAFYVASVEDLGVCDDSIFRRLVYVEESKTFYTCSPSSLSWLEILIQGKDGKDGETGSQGPQGAQGVKGDTGSAAPNFLIGTYFCEIKDLASSGAPSGLYLKDATIFKYTQNRYRIEADWGTQGSCKSLTNSCQKNVSTDSSGNPEYLKVTFSDGSLTAENRGVNSYNVSYTFSCEKLEL